MRAKNSTSCAGCIRVFELIFYTLLGLLQSLVMIFLGRYWIFSDSKPEACSGSSDNEECCSSYVYVCSAIYNIVQYVLYALSAIYPVCTSYCRLCKRNAYSHESVVPYISDVAIIFCWSVHNVWSVLIIVLLQHPQHM